MPLDADPELVREDVYRPRHEVDLRATVRPLFFGDGDPTFLSTIDGFWRAVRTPDGPATLCVQMGAGADRVRSGSGPGETAPSGRERPCRICLARATTGARSTSPATRGWPRYAAAFLDYTSPAPGSCSPRSSLPSSDRRRPVGRRTIPGTIWSSATALPRRDRRRTVCGSRRVPGSGVAFRPGPSTAPA
jgi:hypothetical protein